MSKRARLIYNPTAGREIIKKSLSDILVVYENAGYETSTFSTTPEPLSAQNEAERATKEGFDLIVVAGGDGTINEVMSGVSPFPIRPKVAILPAGTTNDFARALNIPRNDFVKAAKLIEKDETIFMDIGKVDVGDTSRYFINIGAAGSLTELTYEVPPHLKSLFGSLAYFAKGAELLPRLSALPLSVEYDDGIYEGDASLVFIALTNSVGGFEKIAPDKMLGDGKFTLIIVTTANIVEMLRLVTLLMNDGKHIDSPKIVYKKTSKVVLKSQNNKKLMVNLDGEYGGDAPAVFTNIQRHIEFVADKGENKNRISSDEEDEKKYEITSELMKQMKRMEKDDN